MSDYRLDERLQNYGKLIATTVDLGKWRNRLKPRAKAWWWFFGTPTKIYPYDPFANRNLSSETGALAIACPYASQELTAQAIELLKSQVRQGSQTPAVYCLLGNLYSYVGLNLLAEARYLKVLTS